MMLGNPLSSSPHPRREVSHRSDDVRGQRAEAVRLHAALSFLGEFMREPLKVGSVWPSSEALARLVVNSCDIHHGDTVVELGPGTGAFTGRLLRRLHGAGRLVAVELNARYAGLLRERFPNCEVVHDSAENLVAQLHGQRADCIVSGLAWGTMLPQTQNAIFDAILKSLSPHGQFVAFGYLHAAWFPTSLDFRRRLWRHFPRVETTPIVWRNLPPAFVFRCWRD